jgi:Tfp pilus assembly protein PilF
VALNKALKISPTYGPALNNFGLVHRRQGRNQDAEDVYKKAIEHNRFLDHPRVNLGQLYLKQGKEEKAIEQFSGALRVNSYNTIALANLGAYHLKAHELDKAYTFLYRAENVDPEYALAHKYLGMIYQMRDKPRRAVEHL